MPAESQGSLTPTPPPRRDRRKGIIEDQFEELAFKVRFKIEGELVTVALYLEGSKVHSSCASLEVTDGVGRATLKAEVLYSKNWAVQDPVLRFEHSPESLHGQLRITARLYRLESAVETVAVDSEGDGEGTQLFMLKHTPVQYVKKRKWVNETAARW
ncbi:MAG: hypothetical protein U0835_20130 [Isosphaeraceae bacterium]